MATTAAVFGAVFKVYHSPISLPIFSSTGAGCGSLGSPFYVLVRRQACIPAQTHPHLRHWFSQWPLGRRSISIPVHPSSHCVSATFHGSQPHRVPSRQEPSSPVYPRPSHCVLSKCMQDHTNEWTAVHLQQWWSQSPKLTVGRDLGRGCTTMVEDRANSTQSIFLLTSIT